MISLKSRLVLTYSLFICLFIMTLSIVTNQFASNLFSWLVKDNIAAQSEKIAASISEQYSLESGRFNLLAVEAIGMNYVHQGYIITVADTQGSVLWAARSCNMQQCAMMIQDIENRMQRGENLKGGFQSSVYPLDYSGRSIGQVIIETYGPYFYSESELEFMVSLRRFLLGIGTVFTLLSVMVTVFLATTLSKPILKAANTAMQIAGGNLSARIPDKHRTKELHALSQSLNHLAEALENGEHWQKQLTTDVAHELRTPLTTLQGNMEAMIDGVWEPTPDRLASCHEEIVRLSKLVEDLGQLSILEQKNLVLNRTDFDLQRLLAFVAQQFLSAASEKGIEIILTAKESPIFADYDRLKQVFVNLLSNAVKYTDEGQINVQVNAKKEQYIITISDTGIGIPTEEVPHIFERFYRSDKSRNRSTGGAGIGLTIVAAIVSAHRGQIEVASASGGGSSFRVVLPK